MASRKQTEMKFPLRAAPPPPTAPRPAASWEDDLFSNDPFSQTSLATQKKKPPPRPPPPNFNKTALSKPELPQRPAHFNRKPTILSNLMSRKSKPATTLAPFANGEFHVALPPPKIQTNNFASLIDFSSPPSSPTLTTRSSSDGLSVDSFGSDVTSSTANGNSNLGGNLSQAESGFEDDFDLFSNKISNETESDSWAGFDPFSPPKVTAKPNVTRPVYDSDFLDPLCNGKTVTSNVQTHRIPTIIRAKPARPKAPKSSSLLSLALNGDGPKTTFGYSRGTGQTSLPIQDKYQATDDLFEKGDYSPPMPSVPPPPPPALDHIDDYSRDISPEDMACFDDTLQNEEPFGIALYDFPGSHEDDLPFKANDKIRLLRQLNAEWLYGRQRSGMEGMFPANFIDIKVPLDNSPPSSQSSQEKEFPVIAMYDFTPQQDGDLGFKVGDKVHVLSKINEEWLYGEIGHTRGQFPSNYVDHVPLGLPPRQS